MRKALGIITLILCFLLVTGHWTSSIAELIEKDDPVFGPSSIVYDTGTGLEWLNLTHSVNWSYNAISLEFGPGGAFEGFRHATVEEVGQLFVDAEIPYINVWSSYAIHIAKCQEFANLLGPTSYQGPYPEVGGITGTKFLEWGRRGCWVDFSTTNGIPGYEASTIRGGYGENYSASTVGHWLVRETDPAAMIENLLNNLISLNLQHGISNSLDAKLNAALSAIDDLNENNDVAAINSLNAFINAVEAQRGKELTEEDADSLISQAQAIIDLLLAQ